MEPIIEGLTKRQKVIAEVLWELDSPADVNEFIMTLPKGQQREARTVLNLMIWAMLDTVQETNLAEEVLKKYYE